LTSDIATYQEVLQLLTEQARTGSVSAAVALERALRPSEIEENVDEVIDRILAEKEDED